MKEIHKNFSSKLFYVELLAEEEDHNDRLDQFAQNFLKSFSRQKIKRKIDSKEIYFKYRDVAKSSTKVHCGDVIIIKTHNTNQSHTINWKDKKLKIEDPKVIHMDNDIVVISKPPFMSTHPSGAHIFSCATVYLESVLNDKMLSVHRLDRETSGILILARNNNAASLWTKRFENHEVSKTYLLISHIKSKIDLGKVHTVENCLKTQPNFTPNLYMHNLPMNTEGGKYAKTIFRPIMKIDNFLISLAYPLTGRQHQIRTHAAHLGIPLVGDKLYNGDPQVFSRFKDGIETSDDYANMILPRHCLHAIKLETTDKAVQFRDEIPQDYEYFLQSHLRLKVSEIENIKEKIKLELT